MIIVFLTIIGFSALFSLLIQIGWNRISTFVYPHDLPSRKKVTVIIPVRNEEENIGNLLIDLSGQSYPKDLFQVIIVNDHSSDKTELIAVEFQSKESLDLLVLSNGGEGKKQAIKTGIENATGEFIITSDGDCQFGPDWIKSLCAFSESRSLEMVTGPVRFNAIDSIWHQALMMEFAALQGIGAVTLQYGNPTMCNGANLGYSKNGFTQVGGFEGNEHIPSGDDEFLLHRFSLKYSKKICFLKSKMAIVETKPVRGIGSFYQQRQRWASKWKGYEISPPKYIALMILLFNINILFGGALLITGKISPELFTGALFFKTMIDYLLVSAVNRFLERRSNLLIFLFLEIVYPLYIISFGLLGLLGNYTWKGRHSKE